MRLPASRTLRRCPRLPHPIFRRAPRDGTIGLRNPASCDPVRKRGDQVFGERLRATTGLSDDTTATEDFFPNDDFVPNIDNLFVDDMATPDNTGNQIGSSSFAPYVFLPQLLEIMLGLLLFVICLDMLLSSSLLVCMTSLVSILMVMIYLLFSWIKL